MESNVASKSLFRVAAMVAFHAAASRLNCAPGTHCGTRFRKGKTSTRYFPGVYALSMICTDASARVIYSSFGLAAFIPYTTRKVVDPNELI